MRARRGRAPATPAHGAIRATLCNAQRSCKIKLEEPVQIHHLTHIESEIVYWRVHLISVSADIQDVKLTSGSGIQKVIRRMSPRGGS